MLGALVPCGGGDSIPLDKRRIVIGRERPSDILLRHKNVSSCHCELELSEGYWYFRDLNSTNGIRVNGLPCQAKYVMPRDVLAIASHRFTLHYTPQTDRPPPEPERPMHVLDASLLERVGLPSAAKPSAGKSSQKKSSAPEPAAPRDDTEALPPKAPNLGELVPCGGGPPFALLQTKLLIGRHPLCDIVLRYATVSARHCELQMRGGFWHVKDLKSHNGIRVDGVKCRSERLRPHSILSVATQRFEIVYNAPEQPSADEQETPLAQGLLRKRGVGRRKP